MISFEENVERKRYSNPICAGKIKTNSAQNRSGCVQFQYEHIKFYGFVLYNDKTLTFASFAWEECYCMFMRVCVRVSVCVCVCIVVHYYGKARIKVNKLENCKITKLQICSLWS